MFSAVMTTACEVILVKLAMLEISLSIKPR